MDNASEVVVSNYIFNLVVIADISFNQWDLDVVLCTQVDDSRFKALVDRVMVEDVLAVADYSFNDCCAGVTSASRG